MTFKLLVDECLSPELVTMAVEAGHVESTCLRDSVEFAAVVLGQRTPATWCVAITRERPRKAVRHTS